MITIELLSFLTGKVIILPYLATETPEAPKTRGLGYLSLQGG